MAQYLRLDPWVFQTTVDGGVFRAFSRLLLHSLAHPSGSCRFALLLRIERVGIAHGHASDELHAFLALTRARVRTGDRDGEARNALRAIVLARLVGGDDREGGDEVRRGLEQVPRGCLRCDYFVGTH